MHRWIRNIKIMSILVLCAVIIGPILSTYQAYTVGALEARSVLNGMVDAGIITLLLTAYALFIADILLRRRLRSLAFTTIIIINTVTYTALIMFGRALGRYIMEPGNFNLLPLQTSIDRAHFIQALLLAMGGSLTFNIAQQIGYLLGFRKLLNFIIGKYHTPRSEQRVVMFLDLKSSTSIAEQLGDFNFLRFLDDFFHDLSEPILEAGAEIYKYVGDEIILTWRGCSESEATRSVLLLQRLNEILTARHIYYQNRYGFFPGFRAGLHCGTIVSGEMGDLKKEIVHVGDTMNTAARIRAYCDNAQADILASGDIARKIKRERIGPTTQEFESLRLSSIGRIPLKGKRDSLELFNVHFAGSSSGAKHIEHRPTIS